MPGISGIFLNTTVRKLHLPHPLKTELAANSQADSAAHVVSLYLKGVFVGYAEDYSRRVFLLSFFPSKLAPQPPPLGGL